MNCAFRISGPLFPPSNSGRYVHSPTNIISALSTKEIALRDIDCTRPREPRNASSPSLSLSLSLSLSPSLLSSMALANPQTRPFCPVVRPGFINHGTLINRETLPRNQDGTKPFVSVLSVLARGEAETSMETKLPRRPCVAE